MRLKYANKFMYNGAKLIEINLLRSLYLDEFGKNLNILLIRFYFH